MIFRVLNEIVIHETRLNLLVSSAALKEKK